MNPRTPTSRSQHDSGARPTYDHVARLVERHFDVRDSELYVGGLSVTQLAEEFGTPTYVYDQGVILNKINEVCSILPSRFRLFYSIKANPNAAILRFFLKQGCGLEVASGGELYQALNVGCPPHRLIFAGPGKTQSELAAALRVSIREVHVESIEEARCLSALAEASGQVANIALRVNPVDASGGAMRMGGRAAPFGIDEEDLDDVLDQVVSLPNLNVVGVHLFMGTQILDAETLITQYQRALALARKVARRIPGTLKTIDFGGGLGTPYFAHEHELDLERVASGIATVEENMKNDPLLANAEGILEPGRFLVNEAGVYLAKVTRIKKSRGKNFALLDGGMHHHLAASGNLGQTIKRNYPVAIVNKLGAPQTQEVDVVGPLCTPLDMLARQIKLPSVQPGDLFGVFQSGAYARTSSPLGFLSHNAPAEVMVSDGTARLIRRRGEPEDYLRDQLPSTNGRRSSNESELRQLRTLLTSCSTNETSSAIEPAAI
jgi:diaminopimelate decarboxylase